MTSIDLSYEKFQEAITRSESDEIKRVFTDYNLPCDKFVNAFVDMAFTEKNRNEKVIAYAKETKYASQLCDNVPHYGDFLTTLEVKNYTKEHCESSSEPPYIEVLGTKEITVTTVIDDEEGKKKFDSNEVVYYPVKRFILQNGKYTGPPIPLDHTFVRVRGLRKLIVVDLGLAFIPADELLNHRKQDSITTFDKEGNSYIWNMFKN